MHNFNLVPFYFFRPNSAVYITLHNANAWLDKIRHYGLKGILFKFIRNSWLKRITGINVDSENAKNYIFRKFKYSKQINVIPFNIYEGIKDLSAKNKKLRICIPGNLSTIRRDYFSVFKVLEGLSPKYKRGLTLELLGKPSPREGSDEIVEKCRSLQTKDLEVIYHEAYIPPALFDRSLSTADIILGPIKIEYTPSKNFHEVYGVSKDTGVNFAMIRAAKPGLLPKELKNIKELKDSTLYYDSYNDLKEKIIDLIENPDKLKVLKENAKKNSKHFTPEAIRSRLKL